MKTANIIRNIMVITLCFFSIQQNSIAKVTPNGAFSYSIPIEIPKGFGPLPQLSIDYNSNNGNGLIGVGWRIGGLSRISRAHYNYNTVEYDGAIDYDGTDTYSSSQDGVLIAVSAGLYHSKNESFNKFESNGSCGDGPCYWVVTQKDGSKYYYGSSTSIIAAGKNGSMREWPLDKVEDILGNIYTVTYEVDSDNQDYRVTSIDYSNNTSLSGYAISFNYEIGERPDPISNSYPGVKTVIKKRLSEIVTSGAGVVLSRYKFEYEAALSAYTQRSRLKNITITDASGTKSISALPDYTFTWDTETAVTTGMYVGKHIGGNFLPSKKSTKNATILCTCDVDGDGKDDVVISEQFAQASNRLAVMRSPNSQGNWQEAELFGYSTFRVPASGGTPIDIDFDGKDEILYSTKTAIRMLKFDPAQGVLVDSELYLLNGDYFLGLFQFNGDGRPDLLLWSSALSTDPTVPGSIRTLSVLVNESTVYEQKFTRIDDWYTDVPYTSLTITDMNNDGRQDIVMFNPDTNSLEILYTSINGLPPVLKPLVSDIPLVEGIDNSLWSYAGDFNGDGLVDLAYISSKRGGYITQTNLDILENLGDNSFKYRSLDLGFVPWGIKIDDLNGDGKSDIIFGRDKSTIFFGAEDFNFTSVLSSSNMPGSYGYGTTWGDFDGDGRKENFAIVQIKGKKWPKQEYWFDFWVAYAPDHGRPDSLIGVENGLGGKTEISYLPAPQVVNYTYPCRYMAVAGQAGRLRGEEGWGNNCGVIDLNPTEVVVSVTNKSGSLDPELIDGTTTEYSYISPRYYPGVSGDRVYLGYHTITQSKSNANNGSVFETSTRYNQIKPYQGTVAERRQYVVTTSLAGEEISELYTLVNLHKYNKTGFQTEYVNLNISQTFNLNPHASRSGPRSSYLDWQKNSFEYDEYNNLLSNCTNYSSGITPTCDQFVYDTDPTLLSRGIVSRLTEKLTTAAISIPDNTNGIRFRMTGADPVYAKTEYRYEPGNDNLKQKCEWIDIENVFSCSNFDYDPVVGGRLSAVTDANNQTTSFEYDVVFGAYTYKTLFPLVSGAPVQKDANGNALPEQRQTTISKVDLSGKIIEEIDVNGNTTTTQRDEFGRPKRVTNPDGGWTVTQYEDFGSAPNRILPIHQGAQRIHTTTHFENSTRTMEQFQYFDGFNFVWRATRTSDTNTQIIVDNIRDWAERLQCRTKPYTYGDPICEESIEYYFDGKINTITRLGAPADRVIRYSYVPSQNSTIPAAGIGYNRIVSVTNADNEITTKVYNERKQLVLIEDAAGQHTRYEYDPLGNPLAVVLPDLSEVVTGYDSLGRKRTNTDQTTGTTVINYDLVGNVKDQTDGYGINISYVYDELNRIKLVDYPWNSNTQDVAYSYDMGSANNGIGQIGSVVDGAGNFDVTQYTKMGYPKNTRRDIDGVTLNGILSYDYKGRVINETLGDGEFNLGYSYTNSGNLNYVSVNNNIYAKWDDYNTYGKPQTLSYKNGVVINYAYYPNGQLHTMRAVSLFKGSTELVNLEYFYYQDGNIERIEDSRTGATISESQAFTYDSLNRLLTADAVGTYGSKSYQYDSIGNITKNAEWILDYQNGLPTTVTNTTGKTVHIGFKRNGNMDYKIIYNPKSIDQWTMTYSADSKLVNHEYSSASTLVNTTMKYDFAGNRVKKIVKTVRPTKDVLSTFYLGDNFEIRRGGSNNSTQRTLYIKGNGQTLASITTGWNGTASSLGLPAGTYYYLNDHIDSSAVTTDAAGAEVSRTIYMPYGLEDVANSSGASVTDVKYTGQELDKSTGLYNYGARYYDPFIARFITPDTIIPDTENPQAYNLYAYVYNNPINMTDPTGNSADTDADWLAPGDPGWELNPNPDNDDDRENSGSLFSPGYSDDVPETYNVYLQVDLKDCDACYQAGIYQGNMPDDGIERTVIVLQGLGSLYEFLDIVKQYGVTISAEQLQGAVLTMTASKFLKLKSEGVTKGAVAGKITGYTKHGINQAVGRNGGKGVNANNMLDAVRNPKKVVEGANGAVKYQGKKATIILNSEGKVITTYGKSRGPQIWKQGTSRASGSGPAQRQANELGFSYNPNAIR